MSLVGSPLPPFSLPDDQGNTVTPDSLKGSWVVLYAYPKDSTPGCTQESCDFRDNLAQVQKLGAVVLGLSRDSVASHQKFVAHQALNFPLLSDPEKSLLAPLGAWGKKVMYGKETEGILRSTYLVDPAGIIRHVWPKVSVKGHVAEVLSVLSKLVAHS